MGSDCNSLTVQRTLSKNISCKRMISNLGAMTRKERVACYIEIPNSIIWTKYSYVNIYNTTNQKLHSRLFFYFWPSHAWAESLFAVWGSNLICRCSVLYSFDHFQLNTKLQFQTLLVQSFILNFNTNLTSPESEKDLAAIYPSSN